MNNLLDWFAQLRFAPPLSSTRRRVTDYPTPMRQKASYVGVPAVFELTMALNHLERGFDGQCYLVGSALERPDWRDVDVVMIMDDDAFAAEFPNAGVDGHGMEFDPKWLVMTCSLSKWLSEKAGVPIDFKFQSRTFANKYHKGRRDSIGLFIIGGKPC